MKCADARQLFDAYLNGDLPPSLATELGAHRVQCASCRRDLALLEVSGHIVRADDSGVTLSNEFTDRLLACVESPRFARRARIRNGLYIAGPLAAAAVIALAFVGVFDGRGQTKVAGIAVESADLRRTTIDPRIVSEAPVFGGPKNEDASAIGVGDRVAHSDRDRGDSVQRALDLTVLQVLDILEEVEGMSAGEDAPADADGTRSPAVPPARSDSSVEDL